MSKGSSFNYDTPTKNHWRRWVCNRALERIKRLGKKPKDCTVVYLCADGNLDAAYLERKGFRRKNMIAVSTEKAPVEEASLDGVHTIHGDLEMALCFLPEGTVDVLIADFCCGLGQRAIEFSQSISCMDCFADNAVIIVNFLRGRDKDSNELREWSQSAPARCGDKQRAKDWFSLYITGIRCDAEKSMAAGGQFYFEGYLCQTSYEFAFITATCCEPEFYSYWSEKGRCYFDTATFFLKRGLRRVRPGEDTENLCTKNKLGRNLQRQAIHAISFDPRNSN